MGCVESAAGGNVIVPSFTLRLAENVLKEKGATETTVINSNHFCRKFATIIFPTEKVVGRNEKGKIIGEVYVCKYCGTIQKEKVK